MNKAPNAPRPGFFLLSFSAVEAAIWLAAAGTSAFINFSAAATCLFLGLFLILQPPACDKAAALRESRGQFKPSPGRIGT